MLPISRFGSLNAWFPPENLCLFINACFSKNTLIRFRSQTRFLNTDERLFNVEFEVFALSCFLVLSQFYLDWARTEEKVRYVPIWTFSNHAVFRTPAIFTVVLNVFLYSRKSSWTQKCESLLIMTMLGLEKLKSIFKVHFLLWIMMKMTFTLLLSMHYIQNSSLQ